MTRSEIEKRRYTVVLNAYKDVKLAQKARGWSDEHIFNELGLKIPKKTPKRQALPTTKRQKQYYERKLNNVRYGTQIGLTGQEAKKVSSFKRTKIEATKEFIKQKSLMPDIRNLPSSKQGRKDLYKNWGQNDSMPPELHYLAEKINKNTMGANNNRFDETAGYGYIVVFWTFVEYGDITEELIKRTQEWVKPDRYDSEIANYKEHKRL